MEVKDLEVINVMADGGKKVCDHAIEKWTANTYQTSEEMRREHLQRWNRIRERITELAREMRSAQKK